MSRKENLKRLLSPRHVAFVGGRNLEEAIRGCEKIGYRGGIRVVNPKFGEIAGRKCYPSVADLPETPDAAFIGVWRDLTVPVVRELAERGAGGCVCYAAGFAEAGPEGEELQRELVEAAGDMALVGPNCYGVLNYLDGVALWPDLHGGEHVERGVAIVSQSGNIGVNLTMTDRSVPISHVISVGNQAVLGLEDYVECLAEDPRVSAIGLYIEGLSDVAGFGRAAVRALEKGNPIVALKAGASELGTRLALSHTGSLSGSDELYDALFDRVGVIRVDSLPSMLETLKLLAVSGPLWGRKLGVLAGSGGDAALVADLAFPAGLELPAFTDSQAAALRDQLADFASISNPLDYNTSVWGDRQALERCFATVMEGDVDATMLTLDHPREEAGDGDAWVAAADGLVAARKRTGRMAMVASTIPELLPRRLRERLLAGGVVPLQGLPEAITALRGAAWYRERRREFLIGERDGSLLPPGPGRRPASSRVLDEWESKRLLSGFGLRVPEGRLASADGAPDAAAEIGFPVVVKSVDPQLAHKSDLGAVALDLRSPEDVAGAVAEIGANVAGISGVNGHFLVESMVDGIVAELIVGLKRDDRFGLALVFGSGGTMVNLLEDSAAVLLPVDRAAVARALDSLKASRLLEGFRGGPEGDREAVIDTAMAVAAFAEENRDRVLELDINPLLVLSRGGGAVAADALIRMSDD